MEHVTHFEKPKKIILTCFLSLILNSHGDETPTIRPIITPVLDTIDLKPLEILKQEHNERVNDVVGVLNNCGYRIHNRLDLDFMDQNCEFSGTFTESEMIAVKTELGYVNIGSSNFLIFPEDFTGQIDLISEIDDIMGQRQIIMAKHEDQLQQTSAVIEQYRA